MLDGFEHDLVEAHRSFEVRLPATIIVPDGAKVQRPLVRISDNESDLVILGDLSEKDEAAM